ncbi:hypothetical protein NDA16_004986 [Ustilago loliicola]|nr:hypothetical protein NDA16_004986 [Ustilago loliicola]
MMQAANPHTSVSQTDLELLDVLTSMPSSLPHQPNYTSSASKSRPLSTLNALRRPPIDPMVLAASLSSGPHVTRHHFHHSFGSHADGSKSQQMPASQRKAAAAAAAAAAATTAAPSGSTSRPPQPRSRRPSAASGSYANCDFDDFEDPTPNNVASSSSIKIEPVPEVTDEERAFYASRQAPRSVRLQKQKELEQQRTQSKPAPPNTTATAAAADAAKTHAVAQALGVRASDEPAQPELLNQPGNQAGQTVLVPPSAPATKIAQALDERKAAVAAVTAPSIPLTPVAETLPAQVGTPLGKPAISSIVRPPPVRVRCYARTRVPTPHGEIFCHLYKNTHDTKEHLALIIDPYQNDDESTQMGPDGRPLKESDEFYQQHALRSKSLDEVWGAEESDMERIVRGAYVGRLGPSFQVASKPLPRHAHPVHGRQLKAEGDGELAPLVRIHSECFTGETIGSQRCDCGEQLDEAIRLISEAYDTSKSSHSSEKPKKLGRGVIVYLRQEGRGIGLLDKLMAYNLQDMGHDTVSANILLGHLPDARKYDIASAILRDLGVDECRLLTNNPEKMEALEAEGVRVTERVGMVPRVWKFGKRLRRKTKKSRGSRGKADAKVGSSSARSSALRSGASSRHAKKASSLLRQISFGGMESSVISQAGTSDSDVDPTTAGLRHQGEDILNSEDRFESDIDDHHEQQEQTEAEDSGSDSGDSYIDHVLRRSGTTMIGASITKGPELEKYLRTKVERMGHLLALPPDQVQRKAEGDGEDRPVSQPNSEDEGERYLAV